MSKEYYVIVREHQTSGWNMDDTIWLSKADALAAAKEISKNYGEAAQIAIGYSIDGGLPVFPDHILDVPEN